MYNVIFATVGNPPKTIEFKNKGEVLDFYLDNPDTFISINGMQIDFDAIKKNKKLNRNLKLRIIQRKSKER